MRLGSQHTPGEAAGSPSGGVFVLCMPVCADQLGAIFCNDPVFFVDEIMHEETQNLVMLRLFPNISITLEQIYVFKTNRTDYTHIHKQKKGYLKKNDTCLACLLVFLRK